MSCHITLSSISLMFSSSSCGFFFLCVIFVWLFFFFWLVHHQCVMWKCTFSMSIRWRQRGMDRAHMSGLEILTEAVMDFCQSDRMTFAVVKYSGSTLLADYSCCDAWNAKGFDFKFKTRIPFCIVAKGRLQSKSLVLLLLSINARCHSSSSWVTGGLKVFGAYRRLLSRKYNAFRIFHLWKQTCLYSLWPNTSGQAGAKRPSVSDRRRGGLSVFNTISDD